VRQSTDQAIGQDDAPKGEMAFINFREVFTMTTATGKRKAVTSEPVTHECIAARAYDLYLLRGQSDGFALNDWLIAEAELITTKPPVKKRTSRKAQTITTNESAKATPRQRKSASALAKQSRV
jgi:hypothetical protein